MKSIQRKHVKWVLGLDRNTPNYIIEEERKLEKLRIKALKRALKFEEKIRGSKNKSVKECVREKDQDKVRENIGRGSKKRIEILTEEKVKETRYMNGSEFKEEVREKILLSREEKEIAKRLERIEKSSYNKIYKFIISEEEPPYLKKDMTLKDRRILAKLRCGNEFKGKDYWNKEEEKRCRLCNENEDHKVHVLNVCEKTKNDKEIEVILEQEAKEIEILRKINRIRKETETEMEKNRKT